MRWEKKGLVFAPHAELPWQAQFAMLPTPLLINDGCLRIYLGFCDTQMIGRVGYVDVNPADPSQILAVSQVPALDVGKPGAYDQHGVVPVSVLRKDDRIYLYYVGFDRRHDVPYTMFCGLAVSDDGAFFTRVSDLPILPPTAEERYARCGVHVSKTDTGYRMFYVGSIGNGWTSRPDGKQLPLYSMKQMNSSTHDQWEGDAVTALEFANADEHGFGRPYVWEEAGHWYMLYSMRTYSRGYLIGYAESADGRQWTRHDEEAGLAPSGEGWESSSVSYPYLFSHRDKNYVFYNGNGCGKTGFGYAERVA